jgi:Flp pilus assembly secretin CpaC
VIDIFSSAQPDAGFPRGEAEVFHRSYFSVTVNNAAPGQNGSASFSIPFSGGSTNLDTRVITVTATDALGNTSELSAPRAYELVAETALFASGFE